MNYNLAYFIYHYALHSPEKVSLWVNGRSYTYQELAEQAFRVATWLQNRIKSGHRRVAVLSFRDIAAYRGILGACWSGACYVPLNPHFPNQRLESILNQANPDALIIDHKNLSRLTENILKKFHHRILLADFENVSIKGFDIDGFNNLLTGENIAEPAHVGADSEAYLVFTSGTTGNPNGVVIKTGSLDYSISALAKRYPFTSCDRFSQFFDLSFDFSVMDLFVPWRFGASTYVIEDSQKMAPGRFIRDHQLTVWTCVPSIISLMSKMSLLKEDLFPSLRFSFFSGEMLTENAAKTWCKSAPNSQVINLYGQSETIIASLSHSYDPNRPSSNLSASVPLGTELAGIRVAIVDKEGHFLKKGMTGELAISGPHVASGYVNNDRKTLEKFRQLVHPHYGLQTWYITGDVARQDKKGIFHFLGRVDNELKIKGYRVLLEEIEFYLRQFSHCQNVAVIPVYSSSDGLVEALVGFLGNQTINETALKNKLGEVLPKPLIPKRVLCIEDIPLSQNGKVNRQALRELYLELCG